ARFALIEPILICFALGALTLFFAGRRSSGRRRTILVGAAAFMAGCALSCKWTGASALGLMFCVWLRDAYRDRSQLRRAAVEAAMLIVVPIVVYVSVFAIHFALIKRAGVDESIMSPQYRATLVGSPSYNPAAHMSFWAKLRDIHRAIGIGNRQLQFVTHPASSPWYTWPIMKHPIGLWENKDAAPGTKQMIILLGNPLLWWAPLGVLAISLARFRRREHLSEDQRFAVAFLLGGILINFVPFMAITRVMYIYHYLFAMLWGVLLATY